MCVFLSTYYCAIWVFFRRRVGGGSHVSIAKILGQVFLVDLRYEDVAYYFATKNWKIIQVRYLAFALRNRKLEGNVGILQRQIQITN